MSPRTKEIKKNNNCDSSKLERKTVERIRRMYMKDLCFKLASLIPNNHDYSTKVVCISLGSLHAWEVLSQQDRLDYAALYIKELRERVEVLKKQKQLLMCSKENNTADTIGSTSSRQISPVLELRDMGSTLEVTLITGLNKNFMFYQVIGVLEEGALVVNANFSTVGDKVFHAFHSQVTSSRVGIETTKLHKRLKELISS